MVKHARWYQSPVSRQMQVKFRNIFVAVSIIIKAAQSDMFSAGLNLMITLEDLGAIPMHSERVDRSSVSTDSTLQGAEMSQILSLLIRPEDDSY